MHGAGHQVFTGSACTGDEVTGTGENSASFLTTSMDKKSGAGTTEWLDGMRVDGNDGERGMLFSDHVLVHAQIREFGIQKHHRELVGTHPYLRS